MLDEDQVAFLDFFAPLELISRLGDVADVLVTHDDRISDRRFCIELDVRAADTGDFHLDQRTVIRNLGHWVLAEFGLVRAGSYRRND